MLKHITGLYYIDEEDNKIYKSIDEDFVPYIEDEITEVPSKIFIKEKEEKG